MFFRLVFFVPTLVPLCVQVIKIPASASQNDTENRRYASHPDGESHYDGYEYGPFVEAGGLGGRDYRSQDKCNHSRAYSLEDTCYRRVVVYLGKDDFGFRQVDNEPFTFYSEICCSYAFGGSFGGYGGKIFNVSNKTARMRVTCIDGEGLANNVLIIDVKPRTFSRIMFKSSGETPAICRKIKCELIRLY